MLPFQDFPYRVVLGSGSPRRRELLKGIGFDFTVMRADVDETYPDDLPLERAPEYLSRLKAEAFAEAVLPERYLLITADTMVLLDKTDADNKLTFNGVNPGGQGAGGLGFNGSNPGGGSRRPVHKPKDRADAINHLRALSGRVHSVITGVTLRSHDKRKSFSVESRVKFREFDLEEIEYYIDTCQPYDKAGAYGIQEWLGYVGIESVEGSFYNVMGLPTQRLYKELQMF